MATEKDNVNVGLLGSIAAVLTLAVLVIAFGVTALVRSSEDEQVAEKSLEMRKPYDEMKSTQQADLSAAAAWADKSKGTASVPIDRAMALVVQGVQADPGSATAPAPPPKAAADGGDEAAATDADGGDAGAETTDAGPADTDGGSATGDAAPHAAGDAAPHVTSDAAAAPDAGAGN